MDPFRFSISLVPADAGDLTLLREIAAPMARLAGLSEGEAGKAVDELARAVGERVEQGAAAGASVRILFERESVGAPVTVELTAGRTSGANSPMTTVSNESSDEVDQSRLRLTWVAAERRD